MKRKLIIGSAFFIALWTAQTALAWYDPSTGRWLTRDPIGEPGFQVLQAATHAPITPTPLPPQSRWINRDPISEPGFTLFQQPSTKRDAVQNLYTFVGNDPIGSIDLFGLRQRLHFKGPYVCQLIKDEDYCPKWKLINHRCTYLCVDNIQNPTEIFVEVRPTIFKCSKNIVIWKPYTTDD
ncbi:MAG: hypothetical protein ACR2MF_03925 [Chthoniobacterales bacterium]